MLCQPLHQKIFGQAAPRALEVFQLKVGNMLYRIYRFAVALGREMGNAAKIDSRNIALLLQQVQQLFDRQGAG